jgi:hypothetical protein
MLHCVFQLLDLVVPAARECHQAGVLALPLRAVGDLHRRLLDVEAMGLLGGAGSPGERPGPVEGRRLVPSKQGLIGTPTPTGGVGLGGPVRKFPLWSTKTFPSPIGTVWQRSIASQTCRVPRIVLTPLDDPPLSGRLGTPGAPGPGHRRNPRAGRQHARPVLQGAKAASAPA